MTAATHNITIDLGATRPDIVWRVPIDTTGSSWALFMKKPGGAVVEVGVGLTVVVKPSGIVRTDITWRRDETEALALPIYYELWQTEPDGGTRVWVRGTISGVGQGRGATP